MSLSVGILFGGLAVIAALAGIVFLFFAPGVGVGLLVAAAVLGLLSMSSMRSYRELGGK